MVNKYSGGIFEMRRCLLLAVMRPVICASFTFADIGAADRYPTWSVGCVAVMALSEIAIGAPTAAESRLCCV